MPSSKAASSATSSWASSSSSSGGISGDGPLAGQLTSFLIGRVAGRYGMGRGAVLTQWSLTGSPARHPGGGVQVDAEVVLNGAGRQVLAELCGVDSRVLPPTWWMVRPRTLWPGRGGGRRRRSRARRCSGAARVPRAAPGRRCPRLSTGRWQRTLLHGTGNQIAGHAGLRSPALVVASIAVASATVGSGLKLACMKLKGQLEDRKAQHDEAAASTEVVTAEETEAPESPWLRAGSVRRSAGTGCCRSA
ncbi:MULTISPECIES: hypothetical protein [Streptomyces]|uniref:hypothetical protein n=1 Tax=Streptomyces TaxID=1883 RepID=UPI0033CDD9E3